MTLKHLLCLLILASCCEIASAQDVPLIGEVRSLTTNDPLAGVAIFEGENFVGQTDNDGKFRLMLPLGSHTLTFRLLGYLDQEKTATAGNDGPPLVV